jgi:predicted DNA binding CopG/RHH family protein
LQRRNESVIAYKGMQESYDIYESMNALQLEIGTERARNQDVGDETEEERMHVQDVRYVERVRRVSVTLPLPTFFFEKKILKNLKIKIQKYKKYKQTEELEPALSNKIPTLANERNEKFAINAL